MLNDKLIREYNEGFEILKSEVYCVRITDDCEERIVMAFMNTRFGKQYVTWESVLDPVYPDDIKYFWGHYFDDEYKCLADFHMRLAEHYLRK